MFIVLPFLEVTVILKDTVGELGKGSKMIGGGKHVSQNPATMVDAA
jgi:hypothetical protein